MTIERMNDAPILDQMDGHWMKVVAILLHKLSPDKEVVLTMADFEDFPMDRVMCTHAHPDGSVGFKLVSNEEAERIANYEDTRKGHA